MAKKETWREKWDIGEKMRLIGEGNRNQRRTITQRTQRDSENLERIAGFTTAMGLIIALLIIIFVIFILWSMFYRVGLTVNGNLSIF